jgi:hypothetical protein
MRKTDCASRATRRDNVLPPVLRLDENELLAAHLWKR